MLLEPQCTQGRLARWAGTDLLRDSLLGSGPGRGGLELRSHSTPSAPTLCSVGLITPPID